MAAHTSRAEATTSDSYMYCAELTCGIEVQAEVDLVHGPVDQFSISYPEVLQLSDDIEQGKLASPYGIVGNGLDTQSQVWKGTGPSKAGRRKGL